MNSLHISEQGSGFKEGPLYFISLFDDCLITSYYVDFYYFCDLAFLGLIIAVGGNISKIDLDGSQTTILQSPIYGINSIDFDIRYKPPIIEI